MGSSATKTIAAMPRLLLVVMDGKAFPDAAVALRTAGFKGALRVISGRDWLPVIEGKCEGFVALPPASAPARRRFAALALALARHHTWAKAVVWVEPSPRSRRFLIPAVRARRPVFAFYDGHLKSYGSPGRLTPPGIQHVGGRERDLAIHYLRPYLRATRRSSGALRLGVDGDGIHTREATGVQWYRRHLFAALGDDELDIDLALVSGSAEARCAWELPWSHNMCRVPPPIASYRPSTRAEAPPIDLVTGPIDLFHLTFFALPPYRFGKAVATVYDLMPLAMPEAFPKRFVDRLEEIQPFWRDECAKLICISEATRRDLERYMGIGPEKTVCIPVARHEHYAPRTEKEITQVRQRLGIEGPYFMALGSLAPHKNLHRLCAAFALLKQEHKLPHQLVLVGRPAWEVERVFAEIAGAGEVLRDIIFTGYLDYADVPALYSGAVAYCQPSLYEGYGLPVQEAMCCGAPVLVSDRTSLPEVAGDAGFYCDPGDTEDMAGKLLKLAEDTGLREDYRAKSLERVADFLTWKQVALAHREIYEQVIV